MVLRILKNYCHQWFCDSFRAQQIRFRPGKGGRKETGRGEEEGKRGGAA